jgi:phosphatidylglycerophosphatase A
MALDAAQRRDLLSDPAGWIASGFGSGLSPLAPGTAGSLAALLPYYFLRELSLPLYLLVIALAFALGVWASEKIVRRLQLDDPGVIVWDEFVGQWIALIAAPHDGRWIVAGFVLFRFFDVLKPWPVSWADRRIKGGFGVMFDDVLAAIFALIVLQSAWYWLR